MSVAGSNSDFDPTGLIIVTLLFTPVAAYLTAMVWKYDLILRETKVGDSSQNESIHSEKRKRERLGTVLRDLSDEDLLILQKRLQNGAIDDGVLYDRLIGDDGEIVNRYDSN